MSIDFFTQKGPLFESPTIDPLILALQGLCPTLASPKSIPGRASDIGYKYWNGQVNFKTSGGTKGAWGAFPPVGGSSPPPIRKKGKIV